MCVHIIYKGHIYHRASMSLRTPQASSLQQKQPGGFWKQSDPVVDTQASFYPLGPKLPPNRESDSRWGSVLQVAFWTGAQFRPEAPAPLPVPFLRLKSSP